MIVTVMVLELRAPEQAAFSALWPLRPTAISYVVSYVFIAIIWINHHYLMRFVGTPTLGWYGLISSIIAYNVFERDVLAQADATQMSECKRHTARRRSLVVLAIFHDSYVDCGRSAATGIRSDMRRPYPPLTTRGPRR